VLSLRLIDDTGSENVVAFNDCAPGVLQHSAETLLSMLNDFNFDTYDEVLKGPVWRWYCVTLKAQADRRREDVGVNLQLRSIKSVNWKEECSTLLKEILR